MPYDNLQWVLLRIFAAVVSRIFDGECLTTADNGFCCECLRQFFRESFTVNDLRQLTVALAANQAFRKFCRESFTVNALQQLTMAFAANLCGSCVANLLR